MAGTVFEQQGARPKRQPASTSLFVSRSLTGLYTQRAALHDPSDIVTAAFYGGRPDALWDGLNVELTNALTLARRPGVVPFSNVTYPTPPLRAFSFQRPDGSIQVLIDTAGYLYVDNQDGTQTTILDKASGAGQGYLVSIEDTCYYGDGVDLIKYTPWNTNGITWNWSIAPPLTAPAISVVESGSSAAQWQANTYYTTMGLLYDGTNIQQLYTVNANLLNPGSNYGTSSNGQPSWNQSSGGTTTDGGVTWTNQGTVGPWAPNTTWESGQCIYVLIGTVYYLFISTHNFPTTSGASAPAWNTALLNTGARTNEMNAGGSTAARWGCLGAIGVSPSMVQPWEASTAFNQYIEPSTGNNSTTLNNCTIEPTLVLPPATGQFVYLQAATTAGTTGSGSNPPTWATGLGQTTNDGELGWRMVCDATWAATTEYDAWYVGAQTFGAIYDGANFQVCLTGGESGAILPGTAFTLSAAGNASGGHTTYTGTFSPTLTPGFPVVITGFSDSGNNVTGSVVSCSATSLVITNSTGTAEVHSGTATFNPWGTSYGEPTNDGTVTWVCIGASVSWAADAIWYLPPSGFSPPSGASPYGGAAVIASSDVQFVISSGESGSSPPSWGAIGTTTPDNGITWYTNSAYSAQSLAWQFGYAYAYSYKCRTPTDPYVTAAPPGQTSPLGTYAGGGTGGISTASPAAIITGSNAGAVNTISGFYSNDPQCDTIVIWRSADGGGAAQMFELTEIVNTPGFPAGTQWQFQDFLPDVATSAYPGLNELIPAPIDEVNNPPQAGFLPLCDQLHFSRIFGAIGNTVYFSGGPDVVTGNPNEAFNPSDDFPFNEQVVDLVHSSAGLITFLTANVEAIAGGPATVTFYSTPVCPGVGLLSSNALDVQGGEIYFFSTDRQMCLINPNLQLSRMGFAIGDKLAAFDPSLVYVTVHEAGTDNAIYVSDGSTGWYRCNPHQAPQGEAVWSPFAAIEGGCGMLQSLQTSPGIYELLVGPTANDASIGARDLTVFTDNGTAYDSWFTMGSIMLARRGQLAHLDFLECDFSGQNNFPTVSYLLNEINTPQGTGNFTAFTESQFDPPELYGEGNYDPGGGAYAPISYSPNRYYFAQTNPETNTATQNTNAAAICNHLQVKVDFSGDTQVVTPYLGMYYGAIGGGPSTSWLDVPVNTPPTWSHNTFPLGYLIYDSNGNVQTCTTAGTTGGSAPPWKTGIGQVTQDGSAQWTCVKYLISEGQTLVLVVQLRSTSATVPVASFTGFYGVSWTPGIVLSFMDGGYPATAALFTAVATENYSGDSFPAGNFYASTESQFACFGVSPFNTGTPTMISSSGSAASWSTGSIELPAGGGLVVSIAATGSTATNTSGFSAYLGEGSNVAAYYIFGGPGSYTDGYTQDPGDGYGSFLFAFPGAAYPGAAEMYSLSVFGSLYQRK